MTIIDTSDAGDPAISGIAEASARRHPRAAVTSSAILWRRIVTATLSAKANGATSPAIIGRHLAQRFAASPLTGLPDFWEGIAATILEEAEDADWHAVLQ